MPQAEHAGLIGIRGTQAAAVISELDVIVTHIRAGQAAKDERLCVEPELPRWPAAPSAAPGSSMLPSAPASITMGPRTSSPSRSHVTASTTPIPFQELNQLAGAFQPKDLWVPKTCATWADAPSRRWQLDPVPGTWLAGPGLAGRAMIFGLWA